MWEVPLKIQQSKIVVNNILSQTIKPELAQYFHAALFRPTTTSLIKSTKLGYLKIWPGLIEGLINQQK